MAKTKQVGKVKKKIASKIPAKKLAPKAKSKAKKVSYIRKDYDSVTPYLIIDGAASAIDFYKKVFGATEKKRMDMPDGKVMHAELKIGNSKIMLADECSEADARSPRSIGGSTVGIHVYLKNVDTAVEQAVALGAKLLRPVQDMFYGDRSGSLVDPYGHIWTVSTHIEDVTPAQIKKRAAEFMKKNRDN